MADAPSNAQTLQESIRQQLDSFLKVLNLDSDKFLRLAIIISGYLVIRRLLLGYAAKRQESIYQQTDEEDRSKLSDEQLGSGQRFAPIPGDTSDEEEEEEGVPKSSAVEASDWGKKARRRQRRVLKQLVDAEEKRLRAQFGEEDDKDIEEFLDKNQK